MVKRILVRRVPPALPVLLVCLLSLHAASCSDEPFGGLGMRVGQLYDPQTADKKGQLVVLYVMEGLPAQKAGVHPGDIITSINGEPTAGKEFDDLVSNGIRGPAGQSVAIQIERYGPQDSKTLEMTMQRVAVTAS